MSLSQVVSSTRKRQHLELFFYFKHSCCMLANDYVVKITSYCSPKMVRQVSKIHLCCLIRNHDTFYYMVCMSTRCLNVSGCMDTHRTKPCSYFHNILDTDSYNPGQSSVDLISQGRKENILSA